MRPENEAYAGQARGARLAVDAVDAEHGRYRGRVVSVTAQPALESPAPARQPLLPASYRDRVVTVSNEERTGLDVMPRLYDPTPFVPR